MNFFEHQQAAKRRTVLLVLLFCAAVICLIAGTVIIVALSFGLLSSSTNSIELGHAMSQGFFNRIPESILLAITGGVILVVAGGSVYKTLQLRRGGHYVAQSLGGRKLDPASKDFHERKILNVVEEMAIASGNPVPAVYWLEETGINAFAAGRDRHDAVIGVTRGCVEHLSRDELQGVIAHEFSHIHNGDMGINLRLIAVLHGILLIGLLGSLILRSQAYSSAFGSSRRRSGDGRIAIFGIGLIVVGYGGMFFGNLIKSAVSRQREFLADASAVQFTRNPQGISGALKKIGGLSQGSKIEDAHAEEFSHLYFGQGVTGALNFLFATHPPLEKRILRVDRQWDGQFPIVPTPKPQAPTQTEKPSSGNPLDKLTGIAAAATAGAIQAESIADRVAEPQPRDIEAAETILHTLPEQLTNAAREAFSSRALVYGLLLDATSLSVQKRQLTILKEKAHPKTLQELMTIRESVLALPRDLLLPLLQLAVPALKQQSDRQYQNFKLNLKHLVQADQHVSLFEWCVYRIVVMNCEKPKRSGAKTLENCIDAFSMLLNATAIAGNTTDVKAAIENGYQAAGLGATEKKQRETPDKSTLDLAKLDRALGTLATLKPLEKPRVLKALVSVIQHDGVIRPEEKTLLRAVADTLDCPLPAAI